MFCLLKILDFYPTGCIVRRSWPQALSKPLYTVDGGRMTPVSTPTTDNETSSSPFYGLLQQIPLQCFEQERFLQSEILGVQVYPEKGILVLRLKMAAPVPSETYANVSHYLKESLPGVGRVVLDVHYAPSVVTPAEYIAAHEK